MTVIKKIKKIKQKVKVVRELGEETSRIEESKARETFEEEVSDTEPSAPTVRSAPSLEMRTAAQGVGAAEGTPRTEAARAGDRTGAPQAQENTNRLYDVGRTMGGNAPERRQYVSGGGMQQTAGSGKSNNWLAPERALLDRENLAVRRKIDPGVAGMNNDLEQDEQRRYNTVGEQGSEMVAKRRRELF